MATKSRLLVLLQNAYDKGDLAEGWNPSRWRREYETSRTGRRLRTALPDRDTPGSWAVRYANVCPGIGSGPDSLLEPCALHIRRAIRRVMPDIILACGRVAEEAAAEIWDGPMLAIPHPAYRVLTDRLLDRGRRLICAWGERDAAAREGAAIGGGLDAEFVASDRPRMALRQRPGSDDLVVIRAGHRPA